MSTILFTEMYMNAGLHIMIGGKSSFCSYFSELIKETIKGEVRITPNEDHRALLINAKMHPADAIILQDDLTDTDTILNEIKQINRLTKVILFTPRKKAEIKNVEFVFPLKIPEYIADKIAEILTGETKEEPGPVIKEVTDWSVFYLIDFEIFEGLIQGKTSKKIAEDRGVEKCTIDTERKNLYLKAGLEKNVALLALFGIKNKLIDADGKLTELFFELKRKAL